MIQTASKVHRFCGPLLVCLVLASSGSAWAETPAAGLEGFLEPYQTIDIAAPEPGLLKTVLLKEGDLVAEKAIVAELNNDVLEATLRVAEETANSRGKLDSAEAELKLSDTLLAKLTDLRGRGLATPQEIERATVERDVAAARLLAVKEEMTVRKLEAERIQREIEARRLRSPIQGVMTRQWKDPGEYVSPGEPIVLTVVQLDPLVAVFAVPQAALSELKLEGKTTLTVGDEGLQAVGVVEFISPLIDPRSGTAQVKVRIPNADGRYLSGERCRLMVSNVEPRTTAPPAAAPPPTPKPVAPILSVPVN